MEIVLYLIILGEIALLFSIIAYKFFLNDDDCCWIDWFQRERGKMRKNENSALILLDQDYQRFIQQSSSGFNSRYPRIEAAYDRRSNNPRTNTYDDMDDITTRCIEQSLRYKARKERGAKRVTFREEAVITPKCPVVIGLFSTVKPATPVRRATETPESATPRDRVQKRLRYDDEEEEEEFYLPPTKEPRRGMYRTPDAREITLYHSPGSLWSLRNGKDKFHRIEVAIGEALTRGEGEMPFMLRSCLIELLGMSPVTEEDRARRDALIRFVKAKLRKWN